MPSLGQNEPGLPAMNRETPAECALVARTGFRVQRRQVLGMVNRLPSVNQSEHDPGHRSKFSIDRSTIASTARR